MTWKVGSSSPPDIAHKSNSRALRIVKQAGFTAYESTHGRRMSLSPETLKTFQLANSDDFAVSFHLPFYLKALSNAEYSDEEVFENYWKEPLEILRASNIKGIVHPGGVLYRDDLRNQYNMIRDRLEKYLLWSSVDPDLLYLETVGKINEWGHFMWLYKLSCEIGTRICMDFSHDFATTMARFQSYPYKRIDSIINSLSAFDWARREAHIHLSGIEYNAKGEVRHIPLEKSFMPWKEVLSKLNRSQLNGTIIVESGTKDLSDPQKVKDYMQL